MGRAYRALFVSVILVGTLLCGSQREAAGDDEYARATLQGVTGVHVLVESLKAEVERQGLTTAQLQTGVELRLRKAGIRVLSEKERAETPGSPFLSVTVNVFKQKSPFLYAFAIHVALTQLVLLARDPTIISSAETWSTSSVGIAGGNRLRGIRGDIAAGVDKFIHAYRAENPKQ